MSNAETISAFWQVLADFGVTAGFGNFGRFGILTFWQFWHYINGFDFRH
jgi:hypothetical protein